MPGYQLTKNSFAVVLQQIARDTPESNMRIISFHPSIVFTEAAKKAGYTEDTLPWSDGMLTCHLYALYQWLTCLREYTWGLRCLGFFPRGGVSSRSFCLVYMGCE